MDLTGVRIRLADTETAGFRKPTPEASGVVQVACLELDENLNVLDEFCELVYPGCKIDAGATAVHGITDEMVEGKRTLHEVVKWDGPTVFIAHNVPFDFARLAQCLENCVGKLCTLQSAKKYLVGQPDNKLTTLVKHFGLPEHKAHDALGDVRMTREVLKLILDTTEMSLSQLIARSYTPAIPTTIEFGEHRGTLLSELRLPYVTWLLGLDNIDDGLRRGLEMQRIAKGFKE